MATAAENYGDERVRELVRAGKIPIHVPRQFVKNDLPRLLAEAFAAGIEQERRWKDAAQWKEAD